MMNSPPNDDARHTARQSAKTIVLAFAKFAAPALLVGFLLWRIPEDHWQQILAQPKDYRLIAAAIFVALGAMTCSFTRWSVLVRAQGIELSTLEAFRLGAIGFLLSFVSVGSVGGDVFKAAFLAQRRPGKRIAAVASVLVDRACGMYGLLLLVAGGLAMVQPSDFDVATSGDPTSVINLPTIRWATYALIGIGTVTLAVLILGGRSVDALLGRMEHLPIIGGIVHRVGPPLRTFHTHPLAFATAVILSLGVQSLLVISLFLIARGLYADPPGLAEHFVIVPIGMLISALPLSPAGVGVLEFAIDAMYRLFQPADAIASGTLVALVFELVKVIVAMIGVAFYWTAPPEVTQSLSEAADFGEAAEFRE